MPEAETRADAPAPVPPSTRPLSRSIGVGGGTLLTLSCVTPASSLFVIVPPLLGTLGNGTALAIALAVVLCIGCTFCYSELGTLVPSSGGEYAMVSTVLNRFAGWMTLAISMIVVLVVPPIIAIGVAEYLRPVLDVDPSVAGAVVMLASTLMGLLNLRANAWITGTFLLIEIGAIAVVCWLGFGHAVRPPSVLLPGALGGDYSLVTVVAGLAVALFVTQGFSTSVYLAEEMREPRRTVVRTMLWTLGISSLALLAPVVAITLGAPDDAALAQGDLTGMVVGWSSPAVGVAISLCIALAIINAAIVMVIQNSRVVYASARDATWPDPVNRALGQVSRRFGSPWAATMVVGLSETVLCFVPVETLTGVTGVAVVALYLMVAVACLRSRSSASDTRPDVWRMPWWPAVPLVVIAALAYVLVEQSALDLGITAAVLLAAALYWWGYLRRHPDRWSVTVPTD
ncbi:APC family permease [Pseudonocardia eucalypti]|uniref:APC family permease n=1 Tax=Pseudonocardia eucalypti TaxID=648755 RepID=A0ABP9PK56_9PSEU|nr:amino acid transporter [Pseudonocardia eucalypti]